MPLQKMKTKQMTTQMQQHIVAIANTNYRDTTKTDLLELSAFKSQVRFRFHIPKLNFTLLNFIIDTLDETWINCNFTRFRCPGAKEKAIRNANFRCDKNDTNWSTESHRNGNLKKVFLYCWNINISISPSVTVDATYHLILY